MSAATPLPDYLRERYNSWKTTRYDGDKARYVHLADEGQQPPMMVVSCCDSRVHPTEVFGAETGEIFMHRNIANMIPPYAPSKENHGTSAAVEYAVTALKVSHIIVMGHSKCGGIKGCFDMCSGNAPQLEEDTSFVGRWMDIMRPGFARVKDLDLDEAEKVTALEREAVLVSLENLMSFPFVKDAVETGTLSLHGLWIDIRDGDVLQYEPSQKSFVAL